MQEGPGFSRHCSYLLVPFYALASIVLTWPLVRSFSSHLPAVGTPFDALLHVFLLGWGWHGLTTHPLEVFNAPIFYPEVRTLTYMDHMLGEAVFAGPLIEVFGLGAAYNSLILFSFVASAYFTYRLARLYGISRSGSCLAGFLFAFCPYRFSHLGCLNQIQTQFIPLGLFFAVRFLRTHKTRYGIGAALTLVVQSYFGWYGTFHLAVALVMLAMWEVLREPGRWRQLPWGKVATLALMSAVMVAPSALPYLLQKRSMPEFDRPFSETVRLSADLLDYLRLSSDNILAQLFPPLAARWAGFFPGLVAVCLAVVAVAAVRRGRTGTAPLGPKSGRATMRERARGLLGGWAEMGYLPVVLVSGLVLSLGPFLHVGGYRLWIPLPYAACYYLVPGFSSMRTPGRFAILVALATAVLAGYGFDILTRRYPRFGSTFLATALLASGVLAWCPNLPFVPYPDRASMPPVYGWLAAQPDANPVLEVPLPGGNSVESSLDLRRQMYVLYHGKPRLDGASGFTSDRYEAFRRDMQAFPSRETIGRAYDMGARRLIVHYGDFRPGIREGIRRRVGEMQALREAVEFDQDVVYEITAPGAQ